MPRIGAILEFWLDEIGPDKWYAGGADLDADVKRLFRDDWEHARGDRAEDWQSDPRQVLAYLLLTDQFPRNMFRDDPRAFATDDLALKAAQRAIYLRWDERIEPPARQFFYLPLMHSEVIFDQDRCVRLFLTRMPDTGYEDNLLHARAHRDVIRRFGRFPYRNKVLGRTSTPEEEEFLREGGYPTVVNALRG